MDTQTLAQAHRLRQRLSSNVERPVFVTLDDCSGSMRAAVKRRRASISSSSLGKPDCGRAHYPSALHRLLQLIRTGECLCRLNGLEVVPYRHIILIVDIAIDGLIPHA